MPREIYDRAQDINLFANKTLGIAYTYHTKFSFVFFLFVHRNPLKRCTMRMEVRRTIIKSTAIICEELRNICAQPKDWHVISHHLQNGTEPNGSDRMGWQSLVLDGVFFTRVLCIFFSLRFWSFIISISLIIAQFVWRFELHRCYRHHHHIRSHPVARALAFACIENARTQDGWFGYVPFNTPAAHFDGIVAYNFHFVRRRIRPNRSSANKNVNVHNEHANARGNLVCLFFSLFLSLISIYDVKWNACA